MPRRANSFARALADAEKRLAKAKVERIQTQTKLALLDSEIPALERTIHSLRNQLKPAEFVHLSEVGTIDLTRQPPGQVGIPSDLAALVGPQDLTGMGSIPPKMPSEDELLPEDFAEGKKE